MEAHITHVTDEEFEALIVRAIERLPEQFQEVISKVPVVMSDQGRERRAYGLYQGDGIARDNFPDRIIIFKDTLVRDFGHDRELLAAQVERTVRHELGHHLGYDEGGVRGLGL
jgi:predicted Zn-dependent protease with MMP-like domain